MEVVKEEEEEEGEEGEDENEDEKARRAAFVSRGNANQLRSPFPAIATNIFSLFLSLSLSLSLSSFFFSHTHKKKAFWVYHFCASILYLMKDIKFTKFSLREIKNREKDDV